MSTFSWVLLAVGLFLVLYAALVLSGRAGKGGRRDQSVGCGFALVAALVWGIALARYMGDWWAGLRLGFAFALLLPVLATLLQPRRSRVLAAVVLLTLAVLLGASALPGLWRQMRPSRSETSVQEVDNTLQELRGRITDTEAYVQRLRSDRQELKGQIGELGYKDFAELAQDAPAYSKLRELADVQRLLTDTTKRLETMESTADRLDGALRRLKRLAGAESATGVEPDRAEIAAILAEARQQAPPIGPVTVEEHVEREQLKALFDSEFAGR